MNFNSFFRNRKIIWISLFLTLLIWLTTLSDYRFIREDPFLFFSKIVALIGVVGMCWTFLLSTRLYFFEAMFSGLDKSYHAHRLLGIMSFCCICLHPFFQFLRFIPDWRKGFQLFIVVGLGPVELGVLAFVLFVTLISLTLWIKIPYHIWKKTHEFFIFVLLLGLFHIIWIDKQINASLFLSIWIYSFIGLAILSYIYIRFLYWHIGPRYGYRIRNIEKRGKIWNVYLDPLEKKIPYKPAQFIYISFENPKLSKEPHPFSVSSSPDQDHLRLSIKTLGDYTSKLDALQVGGKALLWGPYGRFYEKFLYQTKKDAVFIAGGIGITPFLSLLQFEADHPQNRKIHIFYCVKNSTRAYFNDEIATLKERNPSMHYIPWYSDNQGLMHIDNVKEAMKEDLKDKLYFLCGPLAMMNPFIQQLNQNGVKNKHIIFEDFNLLD